MKINGNILESIRTRTPSLLIGLGIILRVKEWLFNRSLWLDEAYLGMHLMKQSWGEILLNQRFASDFAVPPMGFMLIEKINTTLFGNNELALRLFPLLCGICAIFIFYVVAKKLFSFPVMVAVLALFVFNDRLIEYSCELKQYSSDLVVVLGLGALFLFKTDRFFSIKKQDSILFSLAGAAAVTFSHPAIFVLAVFGCIQQVLLLMRGKIEEAKEGVVCGTIWLVTFLFWYNVAFRSMSSSPALIEAVKLPGFMINVPLWSIAGFIWITGKISEILSNIALLYPAWISVPIFFVGIVAFFRKNSKAALLFVLPLLVAFIAGAAGRYLLGGRFSLFMVPAIFLSIGAMFDFFVMRFEKKGKILVAACLIVFLFGTAPLTWQHFLTPRQKEETRDFARFVQENFKEGDVLIVNGMGHMAMWYYFGQNGKFSVPANYVISDKAHGETEDSYRILIERVETLLNEDGFYDGYPEEGDIRVILLKEDIDFRGVKRIWFFGGHMKGSQDFIEEYFKRRNIFPTIHYKKTGAALMLFEVQS